MGIHEGIKSAVIGCFGNRKLQNAADRAVHLARFDTWCRENPCTLIETRDGLHQHVFEAEDLAGPIDYLEFGVFRGHTIAGWADRNLDPKSRFVGFDTFSGLPEDWTSELKKGAFDTGGHVPRIDDPRVSFEAGLFQDTLPTYLRSHVRTGRTLVHLDADLFSSTLFVLLQLAPMLRSGDLLMFDEFHDYMDEFRALACALAAYPLKLEAVAGMTGYGGRGYARVALRIAHVGA